MRHRAPAGSAAAGVDVYAGTLLWLAVAEVESWSEGEAGAALFWFGRGVTGDDRWTNAAWPVHGMAT